MEPGHQGDGAEDSSLRYLELLKATLRGDWEAAEAIFHADPSARTAGITARHDTPLHVAVFSNSRQSLNFVRRLVEVVPADSLSLKNASGDCPLHSAAIVGNTEAAKLLVERAPELLKLKNHKLDDAPIHSAARYCHEETVRYLLSVTRDDGGYYRTSFSGEDGVKLLNLLIFGDFYRLAFYALRKFPWLAREHDEKTGETAMLTLAKRPLAFPSGTKIVRRRLRVRHHFTSFLACPSAVDEESHAEIPRNEHGAATELLALLISETLKAGTAAEVERLLKPPTLRAAESGIYEMVAEIIKAYPDSICFVDSEGRTAFHLAVLYRRVEVFNVLYQLSTASKNLVAALIDERGDNLLHLAGRSAQVASNAAAGVQRELLWFNEVAKVVPPSYQEMINREMKTPRELFQEQCWFLLDHGEKWMKDTAQAFSFVAVLVTTVSFAALFTLPGGANDKGTANYLNNPSFMVFVAADALAFFSSCTSLLMFLRIMTSKFSTTDFLNSLPKKMEFCLMTLFLSIAAMLIAFAASLHIVLHHKGNWIMAPITILASVPFTLFLLSLFPPLVNMLVSTYGPNVFGKQSDEIIA